MAWDLQNPHSQSPLAVASQYVKSAVGTDYGLRLSRAAYSAPIMYPNQSGSLTNRLNTRPG